jgi:hypothetical protein
MKLHEQVKLNNARSTEARRRIAHFRNYLNGSKFRGHDPRDGLPNNYINTVEVLSFLANLDDLIEGLDDSELDEMAVESIADLAE